MPKRKGNFIDEIANETNARVAIRFAAIGKTSRNDVQRVTQNIDESAKILADMLKDGKFTPTPCVQMTIQDGAHKKMREITIPKFFPDQCVHWMVMMHVVPLIMRGMYEYNCGSISGRGSKKIHAAILRDLNQDPKRCIWCLKMDIQKFYPSIRHDCLKQQLRRIIKDPKVLSLLDILIDSCGGDIGLPIGFYPSQWLGNFHLQPIDHLIKEGLHIPHYYRYMDDMLLFSSSKRDLLKAKTVIDSELSKMGLKIRCNIEEKSKKNWEVFKPRETGLVFVGAKFTPYRISETSCRYEWRMTMTRGTMLRMTRKFRRISKKKHVTLHDAASIVSGYGIARHGSNWRFEKKWLRPMFDFEKAKEIVSIESKKQNAAPRCVRPIPPRCRDMRYRIVSRRRPRKEA